MASYDLIKHVDRSQLSVEEQEAERVMPPEDYVIPPDIITSQELETHYRLSQDGWAAEMSECEAFVHNIQFTEEQLDILKDRGQLAVPINVIYPAVEQAIAMLTTHKPRFQATARDDSDSKTARVIADLMSWIWEKSSGNERLKNAIYDYYIKGRGVLQVYIDPDADYGKSEVKFIDLDPLDVFPDPNSKDRLWRDAAHIIVSTLRTREQIEQIWPDAAPLLGIVGGSLGDLQQSYETDLRATQGQTFKADVNDTYHEKFRVIERYTKVKIQYSNVLEMFSMDEFVYLDHEVEQYVKEPAMIVNGETVVNGEDLEPLIAMYEEAAETEDPRIRIYEEAQENPETGQVETVQIELALITNEELIQMGQIEIKPYLADRIKVVISIGDYMYYTGYLPISEYPIIPINNRHTRSPYPMSDVQFVRPMQQAINKIYALIIGNLASGTNVKVLVPRGSVDKEQVEQDWGRIGGAVIEFDAEFGQPVIAQPLALPNSAMTILNELKQAVHTELGIHPLMSGDSSAAPSTHKGTIAIEEFGQRRIRSKLDDIENSLNHMARIIVPLMQNTYTERKVIRLIEPNNTVRESVANMISYGEFGEAIGKAMDITSGEYDVIVASGSTLPSNRFMLLDEMVTLFDKGLIDQWEVLKKTDIVDADGVMERFSIMNRLQQENQSLQKEVAEKDGDLQTRERELFHARLDLAVAKRTRSLDATANRADMSVALFEQRQADELAMTKREMSLQKSQQTLSNNGK